MNNGLCECGCGGNPNRGKRFITGHNSKTASFRRFIGQINRTRIMSEETREKYRHRECPAVTDELRIKLSIANKGKKHTGQWQERINESRKGYRHSEETKEKMRLSAHRGAEHHNWTGASHLYPEDWNKTARRIRKRDNNTCLDCDTNKFPPFKGADVHHIDGVKSNCVDSNLICLCRSCHKTADSHRDESIPRLHSFLTERYGYIYD